MTARRYRPSPRTGDSRRRDAPHGQLYAVSDLHVGSPENRAIVRDLWPPSQNDWLIVAGDVAEAPADLEWALALLRDRFQCVVWVPGNHELWTPPTEPSALRGVERYGELVSICRSLRVLTPEDPYPLWVGLDATARIAPMFLLYDHTFCAEGARDANGREHPPDDEIVCADEYLLHTDPYPDCAAWCSVRVSETVQRLAACDPDVPLVLVNHWPLIQALTRVLRYPSFARWCGTELTTDWHRRFRTAAVVYGHLHVPRTTVHDGVPFEEVSLGYPREWRSRAATSGLPHRLLRPILANGAAR